MMKSAPPPPPASVLQEQPQIWLELSNSNYLLPHWIVQDPPETHTNSQRFKNAPHGVLLLLTTIVPSPAWYGIGGMLLLCFQQRISDDERKAKSDLGIPIAIAGP